MTDQPQKIQFNLSTYIVVAFLSSWINRENVHYLSQGKTSSSCRRISPQISFKVGLHPGGGVVRRPSAIWSWCAIDDANDSVAESVTEHLNWLSWNTFIGISCCHSVICCKLAITVATRDRIFFLNRYYDFVLWTMMRHHVTVYIWKMCAF